MADDSIFNIKAPEHCKLNIFIDASTVKGLILDSTDSEGVREFRVDYYGRISDLEEYIYAHPSLLSDFQGVNIVVDSSQFFILPSSFDNSDCERIEALFIDEDEKMSVNLIDDLTTASDSLRLLWRWEGAGLYNFFNRTFNSPRIRHRFSPLISYFSHLSSRGNVGKVYAVLSERHGAKLLELVSFDRAGGLKLANCIVFNEPIDAAYYVIGAVKSSGLDLLKDDIFIVGAGELRRKVMEILRQFSPRVSPLIFAPHLSAIANTLPNLPLSLILASE